MGIILDSMVKVWRSEMGDPDLLGWAITVAYFVAAILCARTAVAARRAPAEAPEGDRPATWWLRNAAILRPGNARSRWRSRSQAPIS